jgi:glycosyltransferase involved in cell wall biosynthesis
MLARHLAACGAACRVVAIEPGDLEASLRSRGIEAAATGFLRVPYHLPLLRPGRLDRAVREADVVHVLGYWNLLSVVVAWLARRAGRPYVLSPAGEFAALAAGHPVKRLFHHLLGRTMIAGASRLVAITELERREILGRFGLSPDRVLLVPNGVDPEPPGDGPAAGVGGRPYVLFLGRLAPVKGPDLLLDAFARVADAHPDVDLVLAGPDFGMGPQLRAAAAALGPRVRLPGFLGPDERATAIRGALLLAVPSRDEAMSLVALEAGALGRPVLLTDRCGFDAVADVGGGAVVPATVADLAGGLDRMLSDRDALPEAGERLRRLVEAEYAWPSIARGLLARLSEIVSARQAGPGR